MRATYVLFILALSACSGANGENRPTDPAELGEDVESGEPVEQDTRPHIDPDTACGRALACCRAFCGAFPNVVENSACAGVYEALESPDPDARCRAMCAGWRQALERLSEDRTPPAECVDPSG